WPARRGKLARLVRSPEGRALPQSQRQEKEGVAARQAAYRPNMRHEQRIPAMNIAFCYESVLPARGGCETYIADLARRLLADRHEVHLYACRWDDRALPQGIRYHALPAPRGPRFLRPWRFAAACERAPADGTHDVSL